MRALILGHMGGIGAAIATRLAAAGHEVTGLGRANGLDLTDEPSVARCATALAGVRFGLIVNATGALSIDGAPPEKTIAAIDPAAMAAQFALNATGVALALKHFAPLLAPAGRFATLTARLGSIGDNRVGGWIGYRAAKAAANQIIRTAAIEVARRNPGAIVVALHPGTVATPLTEAYRGNRPVLTPDAAAEALLTVLDGLSVDDNGGFRDWRGQVVPW